MVLGMSRIAPSIELTGTQSEELQRVCRGSSSSRDQVLRARIILLAGKAWPNEDIAQELNTNKMTVCKWRRRFARWGMAGLQDAPRSGRPARLSAQQMERVLTEVTRPPQARRRWSCRSMGKHAGVSKSRVQPLWEQNDLKPHRTRTFKLSNDPQFETKFWDVIGLYLNPPTQAVVLCCDEKSQCQALERTQPGLPLGQGHLCTRTHDYYRHGTLTLFAALNYLEGKIIAQSAPHHRHQEWLSFLQQIDQEVPAGQEIHLIVDNYATHKHPSVKRWLKKNPRVHQHFTPTSSSWLNLVERWFREITDNRIRRGTFRSVEQLIQAIMDYIEHHNRSPKPFVWTAKADEILAKVRRARNVLDKLQSV